MKVILLAALTLPVFASELSVHVADASKQPIPAASVSLVTRSGERHTLTTDLTGSCRFATLSAGQYWVETNAPGFNPATPRAVTITAEASTEATISLGVAEVRSSI